MNGNPLPDEKKATEYLANERTYLAWVRTSIAVVSLGFVVAKFSVWMRELIIRIAPGSPAPDAGYSMPIGIALMAFGGLLPFFAWLHYHMTNKAIERGNVRANRGLVLAMTLAIFALAAAMVINMLLAMKGI
jgi:putative membrane protein